MLTPVEKIVAIGLAACFWVGSLSGQVVEDLRRDAPFFRKKLPEFRRWLVENELHKIFRADTIAVDNQKVTLFLRPAFEGRRVCDSMQCAWNQLEMGNRDLNGEFFHDRLLKKWAFLAEIREEQAEVVVRCHEPAHFLVKISGRTEDVEQKTLDAGHWKLETSKAQSPMSNVYRPTSTLIEGRSLRSAAGMQISLPGGSLGGANVGENSAIVSGKKVGKVCAEAKTFFLDFYKNKGTPVLWKARIDTSFSFEDEFVLEVTHLSNQICPDGYFEYHRIHVQGKQRGEEVELRWDFQGKYGSGILFPPRRNNYKDLELKYKNELANYQNTLFRRMINYLSRR